MAGGTAPTPKKKIPTTEKERVRRGRLRREGIAPERIPVGLVLDLELVPWYRSTSSSSVPEAVREVIGGEPGMARADPA